MSDSIQSTPPEERPVTTGEASEGKRRAVDRLNVPSAVVRASGFVPGDVVFVTDEDAAGEASKPVLVLLKEPPAKLMGKYVVSKDSRIRVTPAMLKKAGLQGDTFEFGGGAGKIVVLAQKSAATT
jgi:hypothetical protein